MTARRSSSVQRTPSTPTPKAPDLRQACVRTVPLYDSLGEEAVEYTVNHSQTQLIFLQADKMSFLNKALGAIKKHLKTVVYWGEPKPGDLATLQKEARTVCGGHARCSQAALQRSCARHDRLWMPPPPPQHAGPSRVVSVRAT